MERLTETKLVLVVRETRLEELKARFNTVSQARFYVEQLGADFAEYEQEDAAYRTAIGHVQTALSSLGRLQIIPRGFLPNFVFGPDDVVVAVGQDGLVANTLKYLDGQPLIGINPDPSRYDGQLLPFTVRDLGRVLPEVLSRKRRISHVTMAKATLTDGQTLYAVNDLFVGPKSHGSARYTIRHGEKIERQSSSGVIISTGMGSTGWLTSMLAGATGVMTQIAGTFADSASRNGPVTTLSPTFTLRVPWDADHLVFTVREPFPSKTTGTELVLGRVSADAPLEVESHMPERGVIFSDGIESDFLEFSSGIKATIGVAERRGCLVT